MRNEPTDTRQVKELFTQYFYNTQVFYYIVFYINTQPTVFILKVKTHNCHETDGVSEVLCRAAGLDILNGSYMRRKEHICKT